MYMKVMYPLTFFHEFLVQQYMYQKSNIQSGIHPAGILLMVCSIVNNFEQLVLDHSNLMKFNLECNGYLKGTISNPQSLKNYNYVSSVISLYHLITNLIYLTLSQISQTSFHLFRFLNTVNKRLSTLIVLSLLFVICCIFI